MPIVLFVLVGIFAFLLASFPARNSDIWMHLAFGKNLLDGDLATAPPPLLAKGENVGVAFRSHSTWLYDILCYGAYSACGEGGLVVFKALLMAVLAIVLMHLGRTIGWWIPAACTALALLTMGLRMPLQPVTISYLFFAVMLLIWRRCAGPAHQPSSTSIAGYWPLGLLFVIWVNLDGWFQLGLITVACCAIGRSLDDASGSTNRLRASMRGAAGWLALAALCLLNPRFWRALAPIPELRWLADPGALPALLASETVLSPFDRTYWANFGQSPAGLAYFPLLGLSLLSILLNGRQRRWQWILPWLALAILSAIQVRVVPFFAVLAGPVTAWNFQQYFAAHDNDRQLRFSPFWRRCLQGLHGLMALLGLAFLIAAWPGWLQLPPYGPRRWTIEPSSSLVRSAQACQRWHEQGKLTPQLKGLHLSRETAQVFAWFCPQEQRVWDEDLNAAFFGLAEPPSDFHERLRSAGIHHVIVHHPDRGRLFAALNAVSSDRTQWPLLYLEGDVAIVGWRDPAKIGAADLYAGWELNLDQLALRPPLDKQAPRQRPAQDADARRWWDAFWLPAPPRSFERDEAAVYLLRAEAAKLTARFGHLIAWEASQAAGLAAAGSGWARAGSFLGLALGFEQFRPELGPDAEKSAIVPNFNKWVLSAQSGFRFHRDDTPAEMLFLAIRAARRALAHDPEDADAQAILGDCYLRLRHDTRERIWNRRLRELVQLRQVQASEALNQAVLLNPNHIKAHLQLSTLYGEMGYLDLALEHRRKYVELFRKAGPAAGSNSEFFVSHVEQLTKDLQQLAQMVQEADLWHAENSTGVRVLDRARMAERKGLAGKARTILVESDVAAFGPQGMALELELLLRTGRAKDVRQWTEGEQAAALGPGNYRWLRAQAFAASGDYALVEEEFAQMAADGTSQESLPARALIAILVGQHVALETRLWGTSFPELIRRVLTRTPFLDQVGDLTKTLRQEADVAVLRGLLAMEQGRTDDAEVAFRQALARWNPAGTRGAIDFDARIIAQEWVSKLKESATAGIGAGK